MRVSTIVLAAAASMGAAGSMAAGVSAQTPPTPARSAPAPVPIEEWSQARVIAMGRAIYEQDRAAWRATDDLPRNDSDRSPRVWFRIGFQF